MPSSIFLSILIPVYNWNVQPLLKKLYAQCCGVEMRGQVEIIVIDDGSSEKFDTASTAKKMSFVLYEELPINRGRGSVRNVLLDKAKGDYVLFLDADMFPDHDDCVQVYFNWAKAGCEILCGGISYLQYREREEDYSFYLYKSKKTEAFPATVRNNVPWRYFFTSNILLRRDIVSSVRFDSRFKGYGFEDIEWAIRLSKTYKIIHIDNTCSHMGVICKERVYTNMRSSIVNYVLLLTIHPEQTAGNGAAKYARKLRSLPVFFLRFLDIVLSRLFSFLPWNPLLFLVFQCDKVVLLAKALKKHSKVQPS